MSTFINKTLLRVIVVALIIGGGSYYVGSTIGYDVGRDIGYDQGYSTGQVDGIKTGYNEGYDAGLVAGYDGGYLKGKTDGLDELNQKTTISYLEGKTIGVEQGNATGYRIGYDKGYDSGFVEGLNTDGYKVIDPTYSEVLRFLKTDKTNKIEYNDTFDCENYAAILKQNAFNEGYQCYIVLIEFEESFHMLNGFNTTDKGFLYIEPQTDDIVNVRLNTSYWDRTKFRVNYNDIVKEVVIYP